MSLPVFPSSLHDRIDGFYLKHRLINGGQRLLRYAKELTLLEYSGTGLKQGAKGVCESQHRVKSMSDFR
ncbi:hypothetical protein DE146DRAFT_662942 [Phaeosphaeria sp. MPI-PUGE-AT-0046c]|nr:hypothetical protein DE146DRAFT_662942 [Phaeosphaeria sp. MPI-PUGE-AT-0046c]